MKKIYLLITLICFISGCETKECPKCEECQKCEKCSVDTEELTSYEKNLEEILVKYGKEIFESNEFRNAELDPDIIYSVSLNSLRDIYGYDTSQFVHEITKNPCDGEYTAVEMIINEKRADGTYDYRIRPILRCYKENLIIE